MCARGWENGPRTWWPPGPRRKTRPGGMAPPGPEFPRGPSPPSPRNPREWFPGECRPRRRSPAGRGTGRRIFPPERRRSVASGSRSPSRRGAAPWALLPRPGRGRPSGFLRRRERSAARSCMISHHCSRKCRVIDGPLFAPFMRGTLSSKTLASRAFFPCQGRAPLEPNAARAAVASHCRLKGGWGNLIPPTLHLSY